MELLKKIICASLALCAALLLLGACGQKSNEEAESVQTPWKPGDKYPVVTITLEDGGVITAELYPDKAPNTVHNFISLAKSGYFDGKTFHRAAPDFMIQGGSPNGDGLSTGFPYSIKGEFANNGFMLNADLKHTPGVLSMARIGGMNDSASCQFFIMHGVSPSLDGDYASFGIVTSGMDVVDRVANRPSSGYPNYILVENVPIKSVTVDTQGVDYPEPKTLPPIQ